MLCWHLKEKLQMREEADRVWQEEEQARKSRDAFLDEIVDEMFDKEMDEFYEKLEEIEEKYDPSQYWD